MTLSSNTAIEAESTSLAYAELLRRSLSAAPRKADNDDIPVVGAPADLDAWRCTSTVNGSGQWRRWDRQQPMTLADWRAAVAEPLVRPGKDGPCYVPGTLVGTERRATAVRQIDLLVYDLDGSRLSDIEPKVDALGCLAWLHSTHSHLSTTTLIATNHIERWSKSRKVDYPLSQDDMRAYLADPANRKAYLTSVIYDATERVQTTDGIMQVIHHDPVEKYRLIMPLATPIVLAELGASSAASIARYKAIYNGIARHLGLAHDTSCEDPSRLYYFPSRKEGVAYEARLYGSMDDPVLFDWRTYDVPTEEASPEARSPKASRSKGKSHTRLNIPDDFDMESLLRDSLDPSEIGPDRDKGGFHIECPHAERHSKPGGMGTFVANGNGDHQAWTIHCCHDGCSDLNRFDHVKKLIDEGKSDLGLKPEPVIAIDKDGQGIDCAAYAKATGDDRAADKIKAGDATVAQLIDAALEADEPLPDAFEEAFRRLVIDEDSGRINAKEVEERKAATVHEHRTSKSAGNKQHNAAKEALKRRKAELGLLSKSEAKRASRTAETESQTPPDSERADFATWESLVHAAHSHGLSLNWSDDLDGYVMYKPGGKDGVMIPYLVASPIRIHGRGRIGSDTTPHLAIDVLQTDGEWTRCVVDLAALSKDPTGQLRALGIRSADYAKLASLLANVTGGEPLQIVDQPGRCGDSYVLPNGEIIGAATVYPTFSASGEYGTLGYDTGGTLDGANELMASIEGQHRTQFLAALSLSAEVAADMGVEMGGLNLLAGSSGGKTTSLCVAMAVRAMGAAKKTDKRGAVRSANVTSFAASLIAARLNGGVLTADEIKECDPETLERLVYEVPNGAPKAAGKSSGDLRKSMAWSVCLMMTGEMTVRQHLEAKGLPYYAGQAVRIVDLPADAGKGLGVFEFVPDGFADIASYANWLNDMSRTHYGQHTRALLREYLRDVEGYQRDARAAAERVVLDTGGNAQVARVARRWQAMIGIAIVAAERGIVPWTTPSLIKATQVCFRAWVDLRGGTADGEALAADQAFTTMVFRDPGRFDDDQISSLRADRGRLGVRAYVDGRVEYWIPGDTELAELVGGQMGRVKPWLDYLIAGQSERWVLVTGKGRRKRQSRRLGNGGWGYCIRSRHPRDQWGEDDGHSDVM